VMIPKWWTRVLVAIAIDIDRPYEVQVTNSEGDELVRRYNFWADESLK
jgi:hypothetical protein